MSLFKQGNGELEFRRLHYQGFYFGDTYRVTRRLTLNFGLRWDPFTPLTDLNNREDQFIQAMYLKGVTSPHFVNAPPGLFYPGDKLPTGYVIPKGGTEGSMKDISPRFGFAWDVSGDGKTSIRGGYGPFYDSPETWMLNNLNDHTPFSFTVQFLDGKFDDPYAGRQNFNVFASDWLLRVGYVGAKTTHLMVGYDQNARIYNYSQTLSQNQNTIDQRRPRPEYENIYTMGNPLGQNYNELQASINKRFSRGFSVLGSYTLSKNIGYVSTNNDTEDNLILDPFNFGRTRGLADSDHTHRFVGSFVWDLPDAGKATHSRAASAILGNWQLSGIVTSQSGSPFSIYSSGDIMAGAAFGAHDSPFGTQIGDLSLTGGSRGQQVAKYFNTAAVMQATPGRYGTLGRNILRGPTLQNTDMSVSRAFPLGFREGAKLWFRSEFFNLFNRPQLNLPNAVIGNATFGRITTTIGDPRILQFSLKVEF
jgi:hypothetical protein